VSQDRSEELAHDLFEAATEARARIGGSLPEKWALIAEPERAIYRAMAFRALHYEDVEQMAECDASAIEGSLSDIEADVGRARSVLRRIKAVKKGKSA